MSCHRVTAHFNLSILQKNRLNRKLCKTITEAKVQNKFTHSNLNSFDVKTAGFYTKPFNNKLKISFRTNCFYFALILLDFRVLRNVTGFIVYAFKNL